MAHTSQERGSNKREAEHGACTEHDKCPSGNTEAEHEGKAQTREEGEEGGEEETGGRTSWAWALGEWALLGLISGASSIS